MITRRLVDSQVLWTATAEDWPTLTSSEIVNFLNDNTLEDSNQTAWNNVDIAADQVLGPIEIPDYVSYLDLEFYGSVATVSTAGATTTGGDIFIVPYGLPDSEHRNDISHPIESVSNLPATAFARQGWISDGLAIYGHDRSSPQMSSNEGTQVGLGNFPFAGQTMAQGDAWHMNWSVGRLGLSGASAAMPGIPEVSGFHKIWIRMGIQNPSSMAGEPTALAITGTLVANLYEERH
jgi:hypothetical protein